MQKNKRNGFHRQRKKSSPQCKAVWRKEKGRKESRKIVNKIKLGRKMGGKSGRK
jgi:ribosomal protein L32E